MMRKKEIVVFAVNFSKQRIYLLNYPYRSLKKQSVLNFDNYMKKEAFAGNTFKNPFRVVPHLLEVDKKQRNFVLPPISWNVIRYRIK